MNYITTPIYYINLDSCTKRNMHMMELLKGLKFSRISAIDGANLPPHITPNPIIPPGANGCLASHITALQQFLADEFQWCIIMEDDVIDPYSSYWKPYHLDLLNNGSTDFDILQLVVIGRYNNPSMVPVSRHKNFWSTGAYLINRHAAKSFVSRFSSPDGLLDLNRGIQDIPCADNELYCHGITKSLPIFSYSIHIDNISHVHCTDLLSEKNKYIAQKARILSFWQQL